MLTPSEGQELAIKFAQENRYSIIAMPPGQGKTLVAVEFCRRNKLNCLVVCPSYARGVWVKEFQSQYREYLHISNFKSNKEIYPLWDDGVAILSYSLLYDRKSSPQTKKSDWLFEWADAVIFDEVHYIKGMENKTTISAHKLVYENRVPYVLMLSGTPAKNRVHELYSYLAICEYKKDKSSFLTKYQHWIKFANRFSYSRTSYIYTKKKQKIPKVSYFGIKNKKELKNILKGKYFSLPKELLHKLPDKSRVFVEAENIKNSPSIFNQFKEFIENNKGVMPKEKAEAALQTAKFTAKFAKDIISREGNVVVFSDHREPCKYIANKLNVLEITGETPVKKRMEILESFKKGEINALVATIGAMSTAVSMTNSNTMVFNDIPWTVGDLEQAERRILRRGQEFPCTYYYIMGTIQSEKIYETLVNKKKVLSEIEEVSR